MLLKSFRVYCINCVRDAEAVGCGGPVDHSGLEEPRSTDRAGRRDRVPSPRQKNCLFRGFFVLIFKRDLIW